MPTNGHIAIRTCLAATAAFIAGSVAGALGSRSLIGSERVTDVPNPSPAVTSPARKSAKSEHRKSLEILSSLQGSLLTPTVREITGGALALLSRTDLPGTIAHLKFIESWRERNLVIDEMVTAWLLEDPQIAVAFLNSDYDDYDRGQVIHALLGKLVEADASGAFAWIDADLKGEERDSAIRGAHEQYADRDPLAASLRVAAMPQGPERDQATGILLERWADKDIHGALEWLESLPSSSQTAFSRDHLLQRLALQKPADALKRLDDSGNSFLNNQLGPIIAGSLARTDISAALQLAGNIIDPDAQRSAFADIMSAWVKSSPETAIDYALKWEDAEMRGTLLQNAAAQVAARDPARAADLLAEISGEPTAAAAFGEVANRYFHEDPVAAARWVSALPRGSAQDQALQSLVRQAGHLEPSTAVHWAARISDPQMRYEMASATLNQWVGTDRGAAMQALEALPISGDELRRLRQSLPTP